MAGERLYSREQARQRPLARRAHSLVALAVARGELPRPSRLQCVDCGRQANSYDHRDYLNPLAVEPVCGSCNKLRGPALPYVDAPPVRIAPNL